MAKTLVIHIGHYKTGTTALQAFAAQHDDFLAQHGVDYAKVWRGDFGKHSALLLSILRQIGVTKLMYDYSNNTPPQKMWADLFAHVAATPHPVTLISSEEFMRIGQFPEAQEVLGDILADRPLDVEVKAVVYLREPGAHLQSWYNQLIKMNYHVADLNTAVNGDIEAIHYDYRHALAPWVELLGAENVDVRSYRYDRAEPAALHDDFFGTFGITLPEEMRQIEDPNPRLDDRAIELVRLMQNLDLPPNTINAVRRQALAYLALQDARKPAPVSGMDIARERAAEGVSWLADLPVSNLPVESFAEGLPQPQSQQEIDRNLLLGFVFSEFIQLRQKVNNFNMPEVFDRLAKLEKSLIRSDS